MSVNVGVDCYEVGTNSQNNTSQVRLRVWISTSGESYNNYTQSGTVVFNGVSHNVSYTLPRNSETTVFDQTIDVAHDSSGNGSCSWSYSLPTTPSRRN